MKTLFKESHPELFSQVHATKNHGISFHKLYTNSAKKIWWQCPINPKHVWRQAINARTKQRGYNCPYCSGRKTLREESFGSLYPQLVTELHPKKNNSFDPFIYSIHSNKKVWWLCQKGHEWQQEVRRRVRGSICPKCKKIHKSISYTHSEIAKEWHPSKNSPLTPKDVNANSTVQVWWQCQKNNDHAWKVSVKTKIFSKSQCPKCRQLKSNKVIPQILTKENFPVLIAEWHPLKNLELQPENFTKGSNQKIWWQCTRNKKHEWEATINNRARGKGCPYCAKTKVTKKNSLAFKFPLIARQWHSTKNKQPPTNISYGSSKRVWWQCPKEKSHSWQSTVASVTQRNKLNCPFCNTLKYVHPDIAAEWHPTKNGVLTPEDVTRASGKRVWWQCPENQNHSWQAIVKNRTVLKSGCPHCSAEKNILRLSEHLHDLVHSDIDYYHIFLGNVRVVKKIFKVSFTDQSSLIQPLYRMLFTTIITAMETYLSDAFCHNVLNNDKLVEKFILITPEFNKKNYTLTEIIEWQKNINESVTNYLLNIIWHNLSKVKNMYKDVLSVSFPDDIESIYKAIAIRHDIVHRNGKTKTGKLHKITERNLKDLLLDIESFIKSINDDIKRHNYK